MVLLLVLFKVSLELFVLSLHILQILEVLLHFLDQVRVLVFHTQVNVDDTFLGLRLLEQLFLRECLNR